MSGKVTVNADGGLEDIRWIRLWSREREVARGVLRSSPIPEKGLSFAVGEGYRFCRRLILFPLGAD